MITKSRYVYSIFLLGVLLIGLSGPVAMAATISFDATAEVLAPISISKLTDLSFGRFSVGTLGGTVTIDPAALPNRSSSDPNIILVSTGATPQAASFTLGGTDTYLYSITLADSVITNGTPAEDMGVLFTFVDDGNTNTTRSGRELTTADTLYVGGILSVAANQPAGAYTGTFNITVAYD